MGFWELLLIAVGLSMDAFAVALCKGLEMQKLQLRRAWIIAVFFGGFQQVVFLQHRVRPSAVPCERCIAATCGNFLQKLA